MWMHSNKCSPFSHRIYLFICVHWVYQLSEVIGYFAPNEMKPQKEIKRNETKRNDKNRNVGKEERKEWHKKRKYNIVINKVWPVFGVIDDGNGNGNGNDSNAIIVLWWFCFYFYSFNVLLRCILFPFCLRQQRDNRCNQQATTTTTNGRIQYALHCTQLTHIQFVTKYNYHYLHRHVYILYAWLLLFDTLCFCRIFFGCCFIFLLKHYNRKITKWNRISKNMPNCFKAFDYFKANSMYGGYCGMWAVCKHTHTHTVQLNNGFR